ncbi:MAG TPA: dihydrolipoamide acetyltransferase family protein [Allosphingosinicella sp.]|nr:dihydrolipoamide acetyltransferase family protein [Allosphingosinicella sp.]
MARYEFRLPDIGEGIAEAEIVAWHIAVGDEVAEDQQIADMMTDKATVELESPVAGKVVQLAGEVGDQIPIGSTLVVLETAEGAASGDAASTAEEMPMGDGATPVTDAMAEAIPSADVEPEERRSIGERRTGEDRRQDERSTPERRQGEWRAEPTAKPAAPAAAAAAEPATVLTTPAVRARARDLGIDLSQVQFSGDRIRHADLDAYLMYNGGGARPSGARARAQDEDIKVVGLRRRIAENMQEAKRRIPHFTYVEEVNVTALEATRAMMNQDRGSNPKLTMLPFLITAMCRTLPAFPMINARYDDEANVIHRSGAVHMGMATQTDNGLSVAVIRNAQDRDIWGLATEVLRLAEATRSGKATREELTGGTITLSSLGPMGGVVSTPVINRPEVAIIAVNKVKETPIVEGGAIKIAKMMNLSVSCDHRVVDGWDAASFMQELKKILEAPLRLLA